MLTRIKLFSAGLALVLFVFVSATCLAQQPQNQTQNQSPDAGGAPPFGRGAPGRHGHGPGAAGGPGMLGALRELNLTDDQKQQIHKIIEANLESTKTQHGELRQLMQKRFQGTLTADEEARAKTLREQMETSGKDTESKVAAILTPEQKAKLEELKKERKANHDRFGGRGGFRKEPGQRNQSTPPPATPPVER